jgi:hypothetical protein
MAAALAFADWQMEVRRVYVAGEGVDDDQRLTNSIIDAMTEMEKSLEEDEPIQLGGRDIIQPGRWVNFRLLSLKKNWRRAGFSGPVQNRVLASLVGIGMLERYYIEDDNGRGKPTNKYRLSHE